MEVVTPENAENPDIVWEKTKKAVENLKLKQIEGLVLYYSGHKAQEGFVFYNRKDVTKNVIVKKSEFESLLKSLRVTQFVAFLDCCNGEDLNVGSKVSLVQLSACQQGAQTTVSEGKSSLFTKVLIQALTDIALRERCPVDEKHCVHSQGAVINIEGLYEKVSSQMKTSNVEPFYTITKGTARSRAIAYQYSCKEQFKFKWDAPLTVNHTEVLTPQQCHKLTTLRETLLSRYQSKTFLTHSAGKEKCTPFFKQITDYRFKFN